MLSNMTPQYSKTMTTEVKVSLGLSIPISARSIVDPFGIFALQSLAQLGLLNAASCCAKITQFSHAFFHPNRQVFSQASRLAFDFNRKPKLHGADSFSANSYRLLPLVIFKGFLKMLAHTETNSCINYQQIYIQREAATTSLNM